MEEDMVEVAPGDGKGQVSATAAALDLIRELQAEYGPIMFHQSGGCCDGSSPMCYPQGEFIVGDTDVKLGEIGDAPVYISAARNMRSGRIPNSSSMSFRGAEACSPSTMGAKFGF